MQFSQFNELESFHQQLTQQYKIPYQDHHFTTVQNSTPQQFNAVLHQIQQINHSRSLATSLLHYQPTLMDPLFVHDQHPDDDPNEQLQQIVFTPSKIFIGSPRKSNIFTSTRSTHQKSSIVSPHANNGIQIYYFGQKIFKYIQYSSNATIDSLINKALLLYTSDYSLDQTFITSNDPKHYQLRFSETQGGFKADLTVEPISRDRNLVDSIFQVLVLVPKNNIEKRIDHEKDNMKISKSRGSKNEQQMKQINPAQSNQVKLNILNESNTFITSIIVNKNDTLQKVIEFLEVELKQKIVLSQNLQDDLYLPQDIDVKNLQSFKLYAKKKKYVDEPQTQNIPLKINSTVPKDVTQAILPPIGITQASRYQQFQVIKINSRGAQQARIIGIDQSKLYNYDVQIRKKKTQASFLSLFLGNNLITGTKRPQRLISEIREVKSLFDFNFQIVFPQKNIQFRAQSKEQKQKIMRKLNFLIQYNSNFKKLIV